MVNFIQYTSVNIMDIFEYRNMAFNSDRSMISNKKSYLSSSLLSTPFVALLLIISRDRIVLIIFNQIWSNFVKFDKIWSDPIRSDQK